MAKRFTDTNKYKKPFIRGLQGAYKVLWDYLYHDCDHAGIWIVDFDIAQIYIGIDLPINKEDAMRFFNTDEKRIVEINSGSKWFIPSFIEFQYGELNIENRAHNSVIKILNKYKLIKNNKLLISSLQGAKYKDKDKDKVKDKEGFENFWNLYDRKAGDKQKCLNKWGALKDEERETIIRIVPEWIKQYPDKQYRPLPSTFLNGQRWNDEILKSKQNTTPQLKR